MKVIYIALVSALLVPACGSSSPSRPTQGATSLFSQVTGVPPASISPTSQSSLFSDLGTVLFRDEFDSSLDKDWVWIREDHANWSLTAIPGFLQINVASDDVNKENITNLLLRPIPSGNIQIETKVTFQPVANFQFAGIIFYESPSNFVQVGRAFCEGIPRCVGDGFYMDYYEGGSYVTPNYAESYTESETVYLQLIRRDTAYTLQTSADGINWVMRGTTISTMNPLQIGLLAGQNTSSVIPALFDYFEVTSLP